MNVAAALADYKTYEMQDVSLLAATLAMARNKNAMDSAGWNDLRLQLEQRLYSLRNWRLSWWEHWARCAEALLPRRYHWLIVPNTMTRGLAINQAIKDPTGSQAVRICTAGMQSGLMSPSRQWFKIKGGPRDFTPDQDAQEWMDEVESRMYAVLAGSNFYTSGSQMFEDLIVFGTSPLLIYEDLKDIIRCYNPCAGEYYLGAGGDFRVNSFYRTFVMTVFQCVQNFGLENVGPEVQGLWEQKGAGLETEVIVAHAIEPNFSLQSPYMTDPNLGVVPGGFEYREYFWLWGRNTPFPCKMKGYRDQPFITPRWATTSNDAYGRSPGMDALPDILQLHTMTVRQAEAIEKMVRPPMMADVSMKNQPSSILPGRVTYVQNLATGGGMKPIYEVKPQILEMAQLIEKIEARVEKWFFNDQFQMLANLEGVQPRNELEIAERRGEKLQVLGPVVEGVENELAAALRRIYSIMKRRGFIPPKPKSLLGVPVDINIISMIALAQQAAETAVMERGIAVGAQMQQQFPEEPPLDNVDPDKFYRVYLGKTAFPTKTLRRPEDVASIRAQRAKAMQAAQQQQQAAQMASHVVKPAAAAVKDVSQIDPGGALAAIQQLTGQGAGGTIGTTQ